MAVQRHVFDESADLKSEISEALWVRRFQQSISNRAGPADLRSQISEFRSQISDLRFQSSDLRDMLGC